MFTCHLQWLYSYCFCTVAESIQQYSFIFAQILVCYHLSRPEKEGSIYLITSTLPVIILLSIELLRSILTYSVGVPEMLSWLLLLIQVTLRFKMWAVPTVLHHIWDVLEVHLVFWLKYLSPRGCVHSFLFVYHCCLLYTIRVVGELPSYLNEIMYCHYSLSYTRALFHRPSLSA